jgi:hypothetical protein
MRGAVTARNYAPAWTGAAAIGMANGTARRALYEDRLGERTAHQVSSVSLMLLLGGYLRYLERRLPIPTRGQAILVGAGWATATALFEFGMGRLVARQPWRELLRDYDVTAGRLWGLVLLWIALGPIAIREELARCPESRDH